MVPPNVVHGALSRALYPQACASQPRLAHRTPWHRDRQPASRHAGCAGVVDVLAQAARRHGRTQNCNRALGSRPRRAWNCRRCCRPIWPMNCPMASGVYRFFGEGESGGEETALHWQGQQPARTGARIIFRDRRGRCEPDTHRIAGAPRGVDQTAGELGALLLEAREIRERQPRYNRQLRGAMRAIHLVVRRRSRPAARETGRRGAALGQCIRNLSLASGMRGELSKRMARARQWCLKAAGARKRRRARALVTRWAAARAPAWAGTAARAPGAREAGADAAASAHMATRGSRGGARGIAANAASCTCSTRGSTWPRFDGTMRPCRWPRSRRSAAPAAAGDSTTTDTASSRGLLRDARFAAAFAAA